MIYFDWNDIECFRIFHVFEKILGSVHIIRYEKLTLAHYYKTNTFFSSLGKSFYNKRYAETKHCPKKYSPVRDLMEWTFIFS